MNITPILIDSIETSMTLNLFKNLQESMYAHIFKSEFVRVPISMFNNVQNFNPNRLQKKLTDAYPTSDRPRGTKDLNSVKHYQKQIKNDGLIPPIYIAKISGKYILLDGAHRIVAHYIENKKYIFANIISLD